MNTMPVERHVRRRAMACAVAAAIAAAGIAVAIASRSDGAAAPAGFSAGRITGNFLLEVPSAFQNGVPCAGSGEYTAYHDGAPLVVEDGNGHVLARTTLTHPRGFFDELDQIVAITVAHSKASTCKFDFSVDVPGSDYYELKVGPGGSTMVRHERMVEQGWKVEFDQHD